MSQELDAFYKFTFEELDAHFRDLPKDEQKYLSNIYLNHSKTQNDSIKIVYGLFLKGIENSHTPKSLPYFDSIIQLTKNWKHKLFPGIGYLEKGIQYYYLSEYEEALNNYLKAHKFFSKKEDEYNLLRIQHYVGLLKNVTNQHEEALILFEQNILFFDEEKKIRHANQYLKSLLALADSYNRNGNYDLAEQINKKGIEKSLLHKSELYPYFLMSYGINKLLKNQPRLALDSLIKVTDLALHSKTLCASYIKISEVYLKLNDRTLSKKYLLKIDSIYQEEKGVIEYVKIAYTKLYKDLKEENKVEEQLSIINKLLTVDSLLQGKNRQLSNRIVKEYETTNLLEEKEKLILILDKRILNKNITLIVLYTLAFLLLTLVFYVFRRNIKNKKHFDALMQKLNADKNTFQKNNTKKAVDSLDIPNEIINSVLKKLKAFEESNRFVKKNYTLVSLAKEFKTNSSYLSKIINFKMGINFLLI